MRYTATQGHATHESCGELTSDQIESQSLLAAHAIRLQRELDTNIEFTASSSHRNVTLVPGKASAAECFCDGPTQNWDVTKGVVNIAETGEWDRQTRTAQSSGNKQERRLPISPESDPSRTTLGTEATDDDMGDKSWSSDRCHTPSCQRQCLTPAKVRLVHSGSGSDRVGINVLTTSHRKWVDMPVDAKAASLEIQQVLMESCPSHIHVEHQVPPHRPKSGSMTLCRKRSFEGVTPWNHKVVVVERP